MGRARSISNYYLGEAELRKEQLERKIEEEEVGRLGGRGGAQIRE
jgi:hypothetical protein